MKNAVLYHGLYLMLCLLCINDISAAELQERNQIMANTIAAFNAKNFLLLEKNAKRYRDNKERTSAGAWKLSWFYRGFYPRYQDSMSREYWERQLKIIAQWEKLDPHSPTPRILHGLHLHGWAATYRGVGPANRVPKENWRPYLEAARVALDYMLKTKKIGVKDPHWYNAVSNIHKSLGTDKKLYSAFLKEALDRYPYYDEIYFAAASYYSPRWHGSPREIESLARNALARTSSKLRNAMYTRVYWATPDYRNGYPSYLSENADWKLLKSGMDDVLRDYPDQWNINNFAYFSCRKGDMAKTAELMALMKSAPIPRVWKRVEIFQDCKKRAMQPQKIPVNRLGRIDL